MHPVNKILHPVGLRLTRALEAVKIPREFERRFSQQLHALKSGGGRFRVFKEFRYDAGTHPASYMDYECEFAARHLAACSPAAVLDIGSYRLFVIGMLSGYKVTTLDVRPRQSALANETIVTSDAKKLEIPSGAFDMVVSLCTLEHFGLGRYGDDIDMEGDRKAFEEMIRVIRPGGTLVFSTTITRAAPQIAFNSHRIYDHAMIRSFCDKLQCVDEDFFSNELGTGCDLERVTDAPAAWDVYCGCWRKP